MFEPLSDDSTAACLDHAGAHKELLRPVVGIAHLRRVVLEVSQAFDQRLLARGRGRQFSACLVQEPGDGAGFQQIPPDGLRLVYGAAPQRYEESSAAEDCADWLLDFLTAAGEPIKPRDIEDPAKKAGFSRSTLYRARKSLGQTNQVEDDKGRGNRATRWKLAGTPADASAESLDAENDAAEP